VRVEKNRRSATVWRSDGIRLEVNFFLSPYAEHHSGKELILDILNSDKMFIPVEDIHNGVILSLNKGSIMFLELPERDLLDETLMARKNSYRWN